LKPVLLEKVCGGRRLERLGKHVPPDVRVGESWEVADLAATSAGGAGGGAVRSVIANGPLAGRTLHDAIALWGERMIDPRLCGPDGSFPLLAKFLDAGEHLSVQVHPSPEFAARRPEAHLKTESWYVIEAEPQIGPDGRKQPAVIYKGVRPGTTREAFRAAVDAGTVVDLLIAEEARPGDCHTLPSGTCHALGAGVLVAEVQTPSDTTFRVYDWTREYGRAPRDLHLDEALECIDFGEAPRAMRAGMSPMGPTLVASTEFYTIDDVRAEGEDYPLGPGCAVIMVLRDGSATLECRLGRFEPLRLFCGASVVVPAACAETCVVRRGDRAHVLIARPTRPVQIA